MDLGKRALFIALIVGGVWVLKESNLRDSLSELARPEAVMTGISSEMLCAAPWQEELDGTVLTFEYGWDGSLSVDLTETASGWSMNATGTWKLADGRLACTIDATDSHKFMKFGDWTEQIGLSKRPGNGNTEYYEMRYERSGHGGLVSAPTSGLRRR
jgi:hypothetical protein